MNEPRARLTGLVKAREPGPASEMHGQPQQMGQRAISSPNEDESHESLIVLVETRKKGLEAEIRDRAGISSDSAGMLGPLATKMFDVGRSRIDITHAFVKANVNSILDRAGLEVESDAIFRGSRGITKKDTSFGMEGEFGRAFARRANLDAATKGSDIGEIILVFRRM